MSHRPAIPPEAAEFLPGLLEIQQRPPSPVGRLLLWLLIVLLLAALIWACWGRVDIVATARGRVITSGREQLVQPLIEGMVRAIHVREGDRVAAGQLLIELDPTDADAAVAQALAAREEADADALRLRQVLRGLEGDEGDATAPGIPEGEVQSALAQSQVAAARSRLLVLAREIDSRRAELAANRQEVAKIRAVLPLEQRRSAQLEKLVRRHLHPEVQWLEVKEAAVRTRHELDSRLATVRQTEAGIARLEAERTRVLAALRSDLLEQLAAAEERRKQLQQELNRALFRQEHTRLSAPVAGVVQELAVHTVGGVVRPAQVLLRIVPEGEPREIEAWLLNRDIGFVHPGQPVHVKLDTFPFTRYGVIDGQVAQLDADARQDPQQGWIYRTRVTLERDWLSIDGRKVRLSPGMSVTVEIRTGERRVIEFLLSPLLRYAGESLRER